MKVYDKRLASPYLVWMALFTVIPLLIVCYYALTDAEGHFTLANLVSVSGYGSVFARSLLAYEFASARPVGFLSVEADVLDVYKAALALRALNDCAAGEA